jgi:HAD superfamily hydrolase (TIGR01509 family)
LFSPATSEFIKSASFWTTTENTIDGFLFGEHCTLAYDSIPHDVSSLKVIRGSTKYAWKMTQLRRTRLKVEAIIFDLDGTLVDSKAAYLEAAEIAMDAIGKKKVDAKTVTEIPRRLEQDQPIDDFIIGADSKTFKDIYLRAYYQATIKKTRPFPNVASTLEKLSSSAKLAVTTRRDVSEAEVERELRKLGLTKYVRKVLTSQDTVKPKPSPEALIKCAKHLGVKIQDCAVVGDSVADIRAGKNAGAYTVAVLTGIFTRKELEREKPDLVLKDVNKLPEFLDLPAGKT